MRFGRYFSESARSNFFALKMAEGRAELETNQKYSRQMGQFCRIVGRDTRALRILLSRFWIAMAKAIARSSPSLQATPDRKRRQVIAELKLIASGQRFSHEDLFQPLLLRHDRPANQNKDSV
jgi:hypothetical protein